MKNKAKWIDVAQNTPMWQQLRCGKVTASNFGCFMANAEKKTWGEPSKKYALQIALERLTGRKAEFSFSNGHMERGIIQEGDARRLYEEQYFVDVTNGGLFDCGDYSSSPDGLVGEDGVIEIKSVIASTHYSNLKRGSADPAYKWQIVGHLECTNREYVDFVSYCSEFPEHNQLIVYRTFRDEMTEQIAALRARRDDFLELIDQMLIDIQNTTA